jgi:iron complex transport system permease protein
MKITLDLSKLVEEGKLTPDEAAHLRGLAAHDTGSLAINILIGFCVIAVSAGALALVPTPATALVLGLAVFAIGLGFTVQRNEQWSLLAQVCLVLGALLCCGAVLVLGKGALSAMLIVTVALAVAAIVARSGLLTAAAVLALGACLGARAGYWHATYALAIYEPAVTVVLFSALALATYYASKRLSADYERLALVAARTSVFMVNFGFWIGSLWGDNLRLVRSLLHNDPNIRPGPDIIPPVAFSVAWAIALLGVGLWAMHANRRWVVNVAAVFGAIHFYTQWFDKLGPQPVSFMLGGLLMLAFAFALWGFNKRYAGKPW